MNAVIVGLAISLLAASSAFAEVHVTMQDGRVTIVARDATIREILREWARVGQTRIVNVERVPGGPETLELRNLTEIQALDVLLRSLSGYIAVPRAVRAANLSSIDRIIILPTLAAAAPAPAPVRPAASMSSSPPPPLAVVQHQPLLQQPVEDDQANTSLEQDDQQPNSSGIVLPQMNGGRVLNGSPVHSLEVAPQGVLPAGAVPRPTVQTQTPVTNPSSPFAPTGGVATPGMVAPAPPPRQPVPRPGGPQSKQ
jgi:hypothetical protein